MSDSSSNGTSFFLILLALAGGVWLVREGLTDAPKPAAAKPAEPATTTFSRAVDASTASSEAANSSMSDQLKSVQQMAGGSYDGQTYVLPQSKK